ncbi:MAG: SDR family oxidoreductase [candidate division Zixibacteria bacterium]|nr:SDR family oxidoreductase [candidate division Zixibacteria bacterium]
MEGKVAVITGGTKGIGRAVARKLAGRGCNVAVNYFRSRDAASETVAELEGLGVRAVAVRGNIGNKDFHQKLFDEVASAFDKVDILVSNAALGIYANVMDVDERAWDLSLHTNAEALLFCAQKAVPLMPPGGKIVSMSSLGSTRYIPGYSAIGISKAAIETLTRYLAYELAPKSINVNAVSGGFIDTDALKIFPNYDEMLREVVRRTPFGRIGTPEEIADVVVFLCTDAARWITGQIIIVDGGYTLT